MGAGGVRTILVGKLATAVLLVTMTVAIAIFTLFFSGKAYTKVDPVPFHDLQTLSQKLASGPIPFPTFVALVSPLLLNLILFLPWGFLMFAFLDNEERSVPQSYLLTLVLGLGFSLGIEATQYFLPTRVTDINDIIWNSIGVVLGMVAGHAHKRLRISFE